MAIRIRRDVSTLKPWDDALLWYAKAVTEMKARLVADPTSWRYQAAIHDYVPGRDPNANPSDRLPPIAEQKKFWRQCQHFSWFFLPWHRWYLLYFEQIVAATIVDLGGPADWALPYWNYSGKQPDARKLPPAFIAPQLPNGSPNDLFVANPGRRFGNNGQPVGSEIAVSLDCLKERTFEPTPMDLGVGGPKTGRNHDISGDVGTLENTPHGSMHGAVGGYMGFFNTAGLDPIFWLHHCNIDRLWVEWRSRDTRHVDPVDSAWLDTISFSFHDSTGTERTHTSGEAVDTTKLGYEYDVTPHPAPSFGPVVTKELEMAAERVPEMVGASDAPTPLNTVPTTARVEVSTPTGPGLEKAALAGDDAVPQRVFLRIENVTGEGHPRSYSVYVNDIFAGIIPLFGVTEATRATEKHGGGGLNYRLDVTGVVAQLESTGNLIPETLRVTFVPDEEHVAADAKAFDVQKAQGESATPFQVGRVSVFVA